MTKEIPTALQGLINADYLARTVDKKHPEQPTRMETIEILRAALGEDLDTGRRAGQAKPIP